VLLTLARWLGCSSWFTISFEWLDLNPFKSMYTTIFLIIALLVAWLLRFGYSLFKWIQTIYYKRVGKIEIGIMYVRYNSFWRSWQCFYMDGYPAEEFNTLSEALDHCRNGQLKKVY